MQFEGLPKELQDILEFALKYKLDNPDKILTPAMFIIKHDPQEIYIDDKVFPEIVTVKKTEMYMAYIKAIKKMNPDAVFSVAEARLWKSQESSPEIKHYETCITALYVTKEERAVLCNIPFTEDNKIDENGIQVQAFNWKDPSADIKFTSWMLGIFDGPVTAPQKVEEEAKRLDMLRKTDTKTKH